MDGILIIDKPTDWTSHDVVGKLRRLLKTKRIGHTGTLDPFATGVLVMLVGQATRLAQFLDKDRKEYEATIQFGFETDTGDLTGSPTSKVESQKSVSIEDIEKVLPEFRGEILQTPPMFSAKKIDGKKLYELARKGVEIERKPVAITIYELEVQGQRSKTESQNEIVIKVSCSAGTYIRTLAEDIGRKVSVPCHLSALRRTNAGKFSIEQAVKIEEAENAKLIPMNEAISHLSNIILDADSVKRIRNGMSLRIEPDQHFTDFVRLTDENKTLISIGEIKREKSSVQPKIVFAENS